MTVHCLNKCHENGTESIININSICIQNHQLHIITICYHKDKSTEITHAIFTEILKVWEIKKAHTKALHPDCVLGLKYDCHDEEQIKTICC